MVTALSLAGVQRLPPASDHIATLFLQHLAEVLTPKESELQHAEQKTVWISKVYQEMLNVVLRI